MWEVNMRKSYKQFYDSLDIIAPKKTVKVGRYTLRKRLFYGTYFKSKKQIIAWVKQFPQLEDSIVDYKEYDLNRPMWDMALVLWISALKHGDYEYADKVRAQAAKNGVTMSRFAGNIFMRMP